LTEGKREFAEALDIHPALINSLFTSQTPQNRESDTQSNGNSKADVLKDENETLFKWLKRQNAFKTNQTIDRIVSALIHIGRVDLAYMFKIDNLRNQCENR
jgi:hypothetical protein